MFCLAFYLLTAALVMRSMNGPYCWGDVSIDRYFAIHDKCPILCFYIGIISLDVGLEKLRSIRVIYGLVNVNDVTHHLHALKAIGCHIQY